MIFGNNKRIKSLKRVFYLGAVVWAVSSLISFLFQKDAWGFIAAGLLLIWFLVFQFIDFQYILFDLTGEKLILRYYSIVKFGRKDYQSIEFPVRTLIDFRFEKSVFGLVYDLILVTRTSRGIAEYPPVSLAALRKEERKIIEQHLLALIRNRP